MKLGIAALALAGFMAGCADPSALDPSTTTSTVTAPSIRVTTTTLRAPDTSRNEYLPGLAAGLFLPPGTDPAPLVVMVPGGAWRTADPSGLAGLADYLASEGMVAITAEVGAGQDGVRYPGPVEDIQCAVGFGQAMAREAGIEVSSVAILGHSSGAHLAALTALAPPEEMPACPYPPTPTDALIGLAGVYDVDRLPALAFHLFGVSPQEDPTVWEEGNPLVQAALRPELPVLLLHGAADRLVPLSFTEDFAIALTNGGHATTVEVVPDADHGGILTGEVSGPIVVDWLHGLSGG